jgi:fructan beta-fructosidase
MTRSAAARPRYHYAAAANWLSDPNGLVHDGTRWHLFYQYNPQGEDWGHMSWGHAVSDDLADWQERPPALLDDDRQMIFSGSAVIDAANTAGFGTAAMVAVYTGAAIGDVPRQSQCLAVSTDQGTSWTKFAGNPVLDCGMADFRDPSVFWHAASARWIMAVALSMENRCQLFASANLRDWTLLSDIATQGAGGHLWECPLLIELPVAGSAETRWLFKVDVLSGAPGSGALYLTGHFDGVDFTADTGGWQVADWGRDFYAAIAWQAPRDAAGRPCWIGWMGNHAYQGKLPSQGWRGAMSLPRRISLRREGGALRLVQAIEPSCDGLFGKPATIKFAPVPQRLPMAMRLEIPRSCGFQALLFEADCGRRLVLSRSGDGLVLTRSDPLTPELDIAASMQCEAASAITLYLDHGSIELLGKDGAAVLTLQHRLSGSLVAVSADRELAVALCLPTS